MTGYDFLTDGAIEIRDSLVAQMIMVTELISEDRTRAQVDAAVDTGGALINVNAHFDHTAALPSAGNLSSSFTDLYTVGDLQHVTNPDGSPINLYVASTFWSMGCHAGLNSPGSYLNPGDDEYDWAQALLPLEQRGMTLESADASLGTVLKYREDQQRVRDHGLEEVVHAATSVG